MLLSPGVKGVTVDKLVAHQGVLFSELAQGQVVVGSAGLHELQQGVDLLGVILARGCPAQALAQQRQIVLLEQRHEVGQFSLEFVNGGKGCQGLGQAG